MCKRIEGVFMKELLLKDKKGFIRYILAAFMFNIEHFFSMGLFSLILGAIDKRDVSAYGIVIAVTVGFVLYNPLNFIISRLMRIGFMRNTILTVRHQAFDKIINMSFKEYSKKSKEVYISNLINDINTFEKKFFISFLNFAIDVSMFLMACVCLVVLDIKLSLIMIVVSGFLFILSSFFSKKTIALLEQVSVANEEFTVDMANTFNGMEILKLNNIEDKFLHKSIKTIHGMEKRKFLSNIFTEMQHNLVRIIGYVIMVGVTIYISLEIGNGLSLGIAAFIFQLCSRMSFNLIGAFPLWNEMKASAKIYEKITDSKDNSVGKGEGSRGFSFKDKIEVKDVSFSYGNKQIMEHAAFTIEYGKKYLIKGASGAGKSTLMKLLAMTYDDYAGEIKVDGVDFKEISEHSFNKQVGFIYQDVFLFEDTIRNNISLYKEIPEERIEFAVNVCGLDKVFADKKKGIDEMLLENGKNLSGGQRQRISIARAIAKDSDILFVDEGTSSLNEELGREIEKVFLQLPKTVIAISHRYYAGVTEQYDYVLEIKNGHVHQYTAKNYFGEVVIC